MNDKSRSKRDQLEHFSNADMFHLLSLFLMPITQDLAEGVRQGSVGEDVNAIFEELNIDFHGIPSDGLIPLIRVDRSADDIFSEMRRNRTKLFAHPVKSLIPISEMQFVDVETHVDTPSTPFLNEAALHAEQCYKEAGLVLSSKKSREPGDHMGIELEFLAFIHARIGAAIEKGSEDDVRRWTKSLMQFRPHLERWGLDFFAACEQCACGVVYPWLGRIGVAFLEAYLPRH